MFIRANQEIYFRINRLVLPKTAKFNGGSILRFVNQEIST